jgi:hypothetical protein
MQNSQLIRAARKKTLRVCNMRAFPTGPRSLDPISDAHNLRSNQQRFDSRCLTARLEEEMSTLDILGPSFLHFSKSYGSLTFAKIGEGASLAKPAERDSAELLYQVFRISYSLIHIGIQQQTPNGCLICYRLPKDRSCSTADVTCREEDAALMPIERTAIFVDRTCGGVDETLEKLAATFIDNEQLFNGTSRNHVAYDALVAAIKRLQRVIRAPTGGQINGLLLPNDPEMRFILESTQNLLFGFLKENCENISNRQITNIGKVSDLMNQTKLTFMALSIVSGVMVPVAWSVVAKAGEKLASDAIMSSVDQQGSVVIANYNLESLRALSKIMDQMEAKLQHLINNSPLSKDEKIKQCTDTALDMNDRFRRWYNSFEYNLEMATKKEEENERKREEDKRKHAEEIRILREEFREFKRQFEKGNSSPTDTRGSIERRNRIVVESTRDLEDLLRTSTEQFQAEFQAKIAAIKQMAIQQGVRTHSLTRTQRRMLAQYSGFV